MVSKLLSLTNLLQKEIKQKPIIRYLLYFIALLPLYFFRDFTPSNELRYLSIADEAIRNQTWFTFSNHGEIYGDKPPLFFWLLILIRNLTGTYSMPLIGLISLLPAIGILWVMDQWIVRYAKRDDHPELIGGLLLFSTVYFLGSTFVIRMDMLMTFFIVLSLFIFYKMHQGEKTQKNKILFLSCIFMGAFTKGPSAIADRKSVV